MTPGYADARCLKVKYFKKLIHKTKESLQVSEPEDGQKASIVVKTDYGRFRLTYKRSRCDWKIVSCEPVGKSELRVLVVPRANPAR